MFLLQLILVLCCSFRGPTRFAADASLYIEPKDMNLWNKQLQLQETMRLIFPNQTALNSGVPLHHEDPDARRLAREGHLRSGSRNLGLAHIGLRQPYERKAGCTIDDCIDENQDCRCVRCVKCAGLKYCSILNNYIVQETYYPEDRTYTAKCEIIDGLGERLSTEIFGKGRTFRDTEQCRDIVLQYLCLFYGSHNPMYTNYCRYQEDPRDADPKNHRVAPRAPCRSFCVQVMTTCANNPDMLGTCNQIACPAAKDDLPKDHPFYDETRMQECTPDPRIGNEVLAQLLYCDRPWDKNPYFKASGSTVFPHLLTTSFVAFFSLFAILRQ